MTLLRDRNLLVACFSDGILQVWNADTAELYNEVFSDLSLVYLRAVNSSLICAVDSRQSKLFFLEIAEDVNDESEDEFESLRLKEEASESLVTHLKGVVQHLENQMKSAPASAGVMDEREAITQEAESIER